MAATLQHTRRDLQYFLQKSFRVFRQRYDNVQAFSIFSGSHYGPTQNKHNLPELYPQRLILPENHGYVPTLSPVQVSSFLNINEATVASKLKGKGPVIAFESNQLGSNNPIEDRRAVARLKFSDGYLFTVFDGHAGMACAQAASERLFDYLAVSLLTPELLEKYCHSLKRDTPMNLLQWYQFNNDYINEDMSIIHRNSLQRYVNESLSMSGFDDEYTVASALKSAYVQLDNDISNEAKPSGGRLNHDALQVALSGACACTAYIEGSNVHVANIGDCRAVLGSVDDQGNWEANSLSIDHNVDNEAEVYRIKSAHPPGEHSFILKNNRLLGQLIPLRAFGDVRYKWSLAELKHVTGLINSSYAMYNIIPMNYYTPPYLIAQPEVISHQLAPNDRFLVIASDGIWEMMEDKEVVEVIGKHLEGRQTQDRFHMEDPNMKLGQVNQVLKKRKFGLAHKSSVQNGASHLLRHALGGEHRKVSEMLTLPKDVVRYYRDDMTIIVVYFDTHFLQSVGNVQQ